MKVDRVSLANFRGFEQLNLSLEEDITVIAGVNGIGKSSILTALSAMLSRALPEFTPSQAKPVDLADSDIRHGTESLFASGVAKVQDQHCFMSLERGRGDRPETWHSFWIAARDAQPNGDQPFDYKAALENRIRTGDLDQGKVEVQKLLKAFRERTAQPLAVFFSPRRQLPGQPRTLPPPAPFSPRSAYELALHDRDVPLRQFMHWFNTQERLHAGVGASAETQARRLKVLERLRSVITEFVPEFTRLRIEGDRPPRFVVDKSGVTLGLNQLSDGERGLLAIVFDITRRLAIANPEIDDPIADAEGVVLIDEIELHLHPKWQREVMRRFTQTFKKCQFIVTSHSPQVLGEVEARCIRFLHFEDKRIVCWPPRHSLGMDSNRVLSELMGVANRNQQIEGELRSLFRRIDEENFEQAEGMIQQLETKLGQDEPELTRARTLIAFLRGGQ